MRIRSKTNIRFFKSYSEAWKFIVEHTSKLNYIRFFILNFFCLWYNLCIQKLTNYDEQKINALNLKKIMKLVDI